MATRSGRRGKAWRNARQRYDRLREHTPGEAVALVQQLRENKFDEAVELHVRTGLNVRHAEEQLRGTVALPNGLGKDVKIAVFAQGEKAKEAEEAGADIVGTDDLAKKIEEGFDDFDVVIATPDLMPVVGRLGKVLGPSGKMPNPKVGTVTPDVAKAVGESKSGKVEYRTDKAGIVHVVIGRIGFPEGDLVENYTAVMDEIQRARPSAAKGRYIHSVVLASTQGPGVKVDPNFSTERSDGAVPAAAAPAAPAAEAPAAEDVAEEAPAAEAEVAVEETAAPEAEQEAPEAESAPAAEADAPEDDSEEAPA
jgi:large subunit ribosomal protein L1